jgi:hypothetical protein
MTDSTVYRSPTALAAIDEQRRRLDLHRTDPATGRCGACGRDGPCEDANDAAIFLAERGLLVPALRRGAGPIRALRRVAYRAGRAMRFGGAGGGGSAGPFSERAA